MNKNNEQNAQNQKITLIAALADNRCIGVNNEMAWHIPEDFAFFKQFTTGKPVIMGRKTWESLPRKPLPNRRNIVISRQSDFQFQANGAEVFTDIQAALRSCQHDAEIIIMGGAQIYEQSLEFATDLRLTEVHLNPNGDAFFPEFSPTQWHEQSRSPKQLSEKNGIEFEFVHWVRAGKSTQTQTQ